MFPTCEQIKKAYINRCFLNNENNHYECFLLGSMLKACYSKDSYSNKNS